MDMSMLRKYKVQIRFVFLIAFSIVCVSLLFLNYSYLASNDSEITFLFPNMNNAKRFEEIATTPSNFSSHLDETICCTTTTNQSNATNIGVTYTPIVSPPLIEENVDEVFTKLSPTIPDPCLGRYIYVYNLPSRFNEDLLKKCHTLLKWEDLCLYLSSNLGLGPKIIEESRKKVLSKKNWYATNQFSLEVIFHNLMKHYKCLTNDSSLASAIYVPYYAGLDISQYLWGFNVSIRDESPKKLVKWVAQQPQWKRVYGKDHFMVGGRIGYDFRRRSDKNEDWGTKLMFLPEASNMSMLSIESCGYDNEFSIPYPTYFHPTNDAQIFGWQRKMRKMRRKYLFSFVGAPRPNLTSSIRNELIEHCESSKSCKLVGCYYGHNKNRCDDPIHVMDAFRNSVFCLQPPGDSYTRRSTFDSILAGCIPVFFHPLSTNKQYVWHFPTNSSNYSVFISESDVKERKIMINETLLKLSKREVLAMRNEVISLIPRIVYRYPSSRLKTLEDAFDVAVKGILGRIEAMRGDYKW